jgi:methylmalonyl-CoA/ethylmalonyl-CoA epimerase
MINKIDHLGIAVKSLDEAIPHYEQLLGVKCEKIEEVASQKVKTGFFNVGGVHIELLEGTSEDSPVAKFIEKKGEGIHHLAFGTTDPAAELLRVEADGATLIDKTPRPGANGKMIGFVHPKSTHGVLTEFCSEGEH